eukprot:2699548-Prymnesium_polylepis.1
MLSSRLSSTRAQLLPGERLDGAAHGPATCRFGGNRTSAATVEAGGGALRCTSPKWRASCGHGGAPEGTVRLDVALNG